MTCKEEIDDIMDLNERRDFLRNQMSESEYRKYLLGQLAPLEVKDGDKIVGKVDYNDNLEKLNNDPVVINADGQPEVNDLYYHGYVESMGMEKLPDGRFVEISVMGCGPNTYIISEEEAIKLIVKYKTYELLDKFELQEKTKELSGEE